MKLCTRILALVMISNIAFAEGPTSDQLINYKITYSHFHTKESDANDINLRLNKDNQTVNRH